MVVVGDCDGGLNSSLVCCVIDGEETEREGVYSDRGLLIEFGPFH